MRQNTPEYIQVKASGGIRTLDDFLAMYKAGATRMGSSATEAIVEEAIARGFNNI
jgi:deoxyribose-phosphate aldolase